MNACKSSLYRWRDVLGYSIVGAFLAVPVGGGIAQMVEGFSGTLVKSGIPQAVLSFSIYLIALWMVWRQSGAKVWHFRHLATYPPTLAAVPVSLWMIVGILYISPFFPEEKARYAICQTVLMAAAIITFVAIAVALTTAFCSSIQKRRHQRSVRERKIVSKDIFSMPLEELFSWLSSETPIARSAQDMFGANERAQRIAKALQTERNGEDGRTLRQTVVVQGPFGAGKSSVLKLAEDYACADSDEHYIFVHVQCWGFSSIAAQEHILEKAIEKLGEEVDCLSLRSISAAYVDAINETNSWVGTIFRMFSPSASPLHHLKRFTPLLGATNAQLVIIIEDTDRNGSDFDQKHLEAMLYNFREVERVSFVLTAGDRSEIEFPKIAEYILFLPPLMEDKVLALLDRMRQYCLTSVPFIDPTVGAEGNSSRNRPDALRASAAAGRMATDMLGFEGQPWAGALASLLNTPRRLKQTLFILKSRWEILRGEVDVDELIILSALRVCAPGVFTFLGSHLRDLEPLFRHQGNNPTQDEMQRRNDRISYLKYRWGKVVEDSGCDPAVLGVILAELVPLSASLTGVRCWTHGNRCQSIRSKRGDIYWERLTAESLIDGDVRDQDVLSVLAEATDDKGIIVLGQRAAASEEFTDLVTFFNRFSRRIEIDSLLQAAEIALKLVRPFRRSSLGGVSTIFESIKLWFSFVPHNDIRFRDWVIKQICDYLPYYLEDANFLYFDTMRERLGLENLRFVRERVMERCREVFENMTADKFSSCFDKDYPYALGHLIRLDNKNSDALMARAKDWRWMAPLLLQSMESHPEIMVPQVMMMFGTYGPGGTMPTFFNYNEDEMSLMFGDDLRCAVSLLAQPVVLSETMEAWFRLAAPFGAAAAERWGHRLSAGGTGSDIKR